MQVTFVDDHTGFVKQVKVGYSWTMFFWGWITPIFRADWKYFSIMLITDIILGYLFGIATWGYNAVMAFYYNKWYTKDLVEKGYRPANQHDKDLLVEKGYISNHLEVSTTYNN